MNQGPVAPPTVRDYLRILLRRWWVVVLGIVVFTALLVAYSYRGPTIWKATSEVRFSSGDSAVAVNSGNKVSSGSASQEVLTEVEVIKSPNFKNAIIAKMSLGKKAIKQVSVSNVLSTNAIKISIGMSTPAQAVAVADQYANTYVQQVEAQQTELTKERTASTQAQLSSVKKTVDSLTAAINTEAKRIEAQDATLVAQGKQALRTSALLVTLQAQYNQAIPGLTALQTQYFQVIQANAAAQPVVAKIADAQTPTTKSQPTPVKYGLVGAFLGIIFGIAGAFGFELLTDKVRTRQDVERFSRLPVLATVPRRGAGGATGRPVALENPASRKAEAYRAARAGVLDRVGQCLGDAALFPTTQGLFHQPILAGMKTQEYRPAARVHDAREYGEQLRDRFGLVVHRHP